MAVLAGVERSQFFPKTLESTLLSYLRHLNHLSKTPQLFRIVARTHPYFLDPSV